MARLPFFRVVAATVAAVGALLPTLVPASAVACPDCATARVVQASVFDGSFWTNLMLIALPILILSAIGALLYGVGLEPDARRGDKEGRCDRIPER